MSFPKLKVMIIYLEPKYIAKKTASISTIISIAKSR